MLELRWPVFALGLALLVSLGCRAPGGSAGKESAASKAAESTEAAGGRAGLVELKGLDTSALTDRERKKWSQAVSELLAPCDDQPVSIAACVSEARACDACRPAAEFLLERVRRGESRKQLEAAFNARFSSDAVKNVDPGSSARLGAPEPAVQIVEWADFECPYCGLAAPVLKQLVARYPDQVQLVFKHYPLSAHPNADQAARAAVAAQKQGKFWPVQQALFASQREGLGELQVRAIAREQDLDMKRFEADRTSEATADVVAADRKQADALGLRGTPMIFINGRHFALDTFSLEEDLEPWVRLEIALRTGKAPVQAAKGQRSANSGG